MKLIHGISRIFCVLTVVFVTSITPTLAAVSNQQTGSTIYLPLVTTPLTPIIPETTNVLTDATAQFLTSISNDGTFTFNQMTPELANIAPDEVIVGGVSTAAPYGFLRKVAAISNVGGQVIMQTAAATLEDAIEQGEVHINQTLSPTNVQERNLGDGVVVSEKQGEYFIKLKDVVLYDEDKNQETKNDQVLANGSIKVGITFNFDMAIQSQKLKQLIFTTNVQETTELQVEARVSSASIKGELQIGPSYYLPSLTYFIGIFPLVLTPKLTFHLGGDGNVHVGVSAGVTQQATLKAGVRYENSTWTPIKDFTNNFQPNLPKLSAGLDLKGYAGPRLTLIINGVIDGPSIDARAFLKLEANLLNIPWWTLYGGMEVPLAIKIAVFSHSLEDYQTVLIGYQVLLAEAQIASEGTCGKFVYVSQGPDRYPIFIPTGSIEPWFIDPSIFGILALLRLVGKLSTHLRMRI